MEIIFTADMLQSNRNWKFNSTLHDQVTDLAKLLLKSCGWGLSFVFQDHCSVLFEFALRKKGGKVYLWVLVSPKKAVMQEGHSLSASICEYTYRAHNRQYAWHQITAVCLESLENQEPMNPGNEGTLSRLAAISFNGQLGEEKGKIAKRQRQGQSYCRKVDQISSSTVKLFSGLRKQWSESNKLSLSF